MVPGLVSLVVMSILTIIQTIFVRYTRTITNQAQKRQCDTHLSFWPMTVCDPWKRV